MSFTYSLEHVNHPLTHPEGLSDSSSVLLLGLTQEALQDSFHMVIVPPPPIPLDKTTTISMLKILLTPLPTMVLRDKSPTYNNCTDHCLSLKKKMLPNLKIDSFDSLFLEYCIIDGSTNLFIKLT